MSSGNRSNGYNMRQKLSAEMPQKNQKYRWYVLPLLTSTATFVASIPISCMPVLFKEISDDLGLSLVQIGTIWGMVNLGGIFVSIIAGLLSDKFGVKLILSIFCVLVGITGALRGISNSFLFLAVTVFAQGIFRLIIPVTISKTVGIWFKGRNLGMAMAIASMGYGLGLTLGPMISATVLSPALGGWRNVMYLYGAIPFAIGLLWFIFGREPYQVDPTKVASDTVPLRQAFLESIRLKDVWFIGLTLMAYVGCLIGMAGYLPLYLRGKGWEAASADGALAAFFAISTLCVVPLSFLSDRIGSRRIILFTALIITIICLALLPVADGGLIWVLTLLAGLFLDGSIAISVTMLLETEGLQPNYSGIALGVIYTMINIGQVASPPLGNSLARFNPGAPFFFWSSLAVLALVPLALIKETGWRSKLQLS